MKLKVIQNILIVIVFLTLVGAIGLGAFNTYSKIRDLNIDFKLMDFGSFGPDKFDFRFNFSDTGFKGFSFDRGFSGPGGCSSEQDCVAYCQNPENYSACQDFNVKIQDEIIDEYKGQFSGPGGCQSMDECEKYCQNPSHYDECSQYGAPPPEMEMKFQGGHGGCKSEKECEQYCSDSARQDECKKSRGEDETPKESQSRSKRL